MASPQRRRSILDSSIPAKALAVLEACLWPGNAAAALVASWCRAPHDSDMDSREASNQRRLFVDSPHRAPTFWAMRKAAYHVFLLRLAVRTPKFAHDGNALLEPLCITCPRCNAISVPDSREHDNLTLSRRPTWRGDRVRRSKRSFVLFMILGHTIWKCLLKYTKRPPSWLPAKRNLRTARVASVVDRHAWMTREWISNALNDARMDFTIVLEITQEKIEHELPHQTQLDTTMTRTEARIQELRRELATLRHLCWMSAVKAFAEQRERELRALKVERAFSRHQDGAQDSENEIRHLERILDHMEKRKDETTGKFIVRVIEPLLIANGRVQPEAVPPGSGHGTESDERHVASDTRSQVTRTPEERYKYARNDLIEIEEGLELHKRDWYTEEIYHMLACTHSTRGFYNALMQERLLHIEIELAKAQVEFRAAMEELLRLGIGLPPITEPSDVSSPRESGVGGRISVSDRQSQDSRRQRRLRRREANVRAKRDFVNRWQIASKPGGSATQSRSPTSDVIRVDMLENGSRSSGYSGELTPTSSKKIKIERIHRCPARFES
ncbi:hypothetical protein CERZMDRAFT_86606 [Cercospora zeae-maydis SCOH1-5]|uniref:Uncharacterized protein n=1 Tax=Cercospora zeae-maydis SCOH1-5 TaxID=717836 RepID=A0A6A6F9A6_9PEZI|nr:hypothetical protein CERZMDRAFT_86606 [Cercospora zeae-maydis SCOH1-5]